MSTIQIGAKTDAIMGLTTRLKEQTVVAYCLEDSKVSAYFLDHFNGIPIIGYRNARQHLQKAYSQKTASVTTPGSIETSCPDWLYM